MTPRLAVHITRDAAWLIDDYRRYHLAFEIRNKGGWGYPPAVLQSRRYCIKFTLSLLYTEVP